MLFEKCHVSCEDTYRSAVALSNIDSKERILHLRIDVQSKVKRRTNIPQVSFYLSGIKKTGLDVISLIFYSNALHKKQI